MGASTDRPPAADGTAGSVSEASFDLVRERRRFAGHADLVLAGGGVKGVAHVGAIRALQTAGYTEHPRVAGTSVGAIVGALLVATRSVDTLETQLASLNFRKMRDAGRDVGPIGQAKSLVWDRGRYEGNAFVRWLEPLLDGLTFGDLKTERRRWQQANGLEVDDESPLVIMATDVTRGRLVQFPRDYPDYGLDPDAQPVAHAVRASMSVPLFFEPAKVGDSWFVDGGVLANFAVDVLDRALPQDPDVVSSRHLQPRWPTFGITLMENEKPGKIGADLINGVTSLGALQNLALGPLSPFLNELIGSLVIGQDADRGSRWWMSERTIRVDTTDVGIVEFKVDDDGRAELVRSGKAAVKRFLNTTWPAHADDGFGYDGRAQFPLPGTVSFGGRGKPAKPEPCLPPVPTTPFVPRPSSRHARKKAAA